MKRFIIDFIVAFFIIIGIFGLSGSNDDNIDIPSYDSEVEDEKSKEDINELVNRLENAIPLAKTLIEEFMDKELNDIYHNDFEGIKITQ